MSSCMKNDFAGPEYSEVELASLSDEEREALLGDDGNDNEETEAASAPPFPAEAQIPQPQAMYLAYDGPSLESLDQKGAELDSLFEDGDIDLIEYTRERDALMASRVRAEMVADHNAAVHQGVWKAEQTAFFREHPEYRANPVLNLALRHTFKDLDHEGNSHLSGLELLNEARKQVEQHLPGGMVAGGGKASREAVEAQAHAHHDLAGGGSHHAGGLGGGTDEFAHLDRLTGDEYERALARLTDDQAERYLRS